MATSRNSEKKGSNQKNDLKGRQKADLQKQAKSSMAKQAATKNNTKQKKRITKKEIWQTIKKLRRILALKDSQKEDRKIVSQRMAKQMKVVVLAVIMVFALLIVHVVHLAIPNTQEYSRRAMGQLNYNSTVKLAAPGTILDSNHNIIAGTYRVYMLIIEPKVILETEKLYKGSKEAILQMTSEICEVEYSLLKQLVEEKPNSNYERVYVETVLDGEVQKTKLLVSEENRQLFLEKQTEINNPKAVEESQAETEGSDSKEAEDEEKKSKIRIAGVWFEEEFRRYYPYDELASKIIGYRTQDTTEGIWGLEQYYSSVIKGVNGREFNYLNDDGNVEKVLIEPEDGKTVVSTIDMNLQRLISEELKDWYEKTDENGAYVNSAKAVNILLMDPNTGAIKAYVSDTDYNLNDPLNLDVFYTKEEQEVFAENEEAYEIAYQEALAAAEENNTAIEFEWDYKTDPTTTYIVNQIQRNGLISNSYEPGSTGKIPTYAAAIEEGLIQPDTHFLCQGSTLVGRTIINCHNAPKGGCGDITSFEAVAASCNVAFVDMGLRLGAETFAHYQELFQFGQKTGIDLPGEESCANLLYPADKMTDLDLVTNAFGQNYHVTMMQLAAATAASINGGYYYKPYVVSEILNADGTTYQKTEPVMLRQVISNESSALVRDAMRQTTTHQTLGTGGGVQVSNDRIMDIEIIAKTGTAEKQPRKDKKYIISVISAAPYENPTMLLYVTIDEYGGELQADSAPAQYLSGSIWGAIHDYVGIFENSAEGPEIHQTQSALSNEAWIDGMSPLEDIEGDYEQEPVPPSADTTEATIFIDPDQIINPEDVMPDGPES